MAELALENRTTAIPVSKLPLPQDAWGQAKWLFWRSIYPIYPQLLSTVLTLGILKHEGRQRGMLGKIAPGKDIKDLLAYLEQQNFGNHFIAWVDDGELIGLRRLDGFTHQYHLRIFKDGEVRGHYEFTPEFHPILHVKEIGEEMRAEEFQKILKGWIVPTSETN